MIELYKDIFHVDLGPYSRLLPRRKVAKVILQTMVLWGKTLKDQLLYGKKELIGPIPPEQSIWLLAGSKNNLDSLRFLEEALPNAYFITLNKKTQAYGDYPRISFHRQWQRWGWGILQFGTFWRYFEQMIWWRLDEYWRGMGTDVVARRILKKYQPKAIIFANDHSGVFRAILHAAKSHTIPTAYIQHASISELFPPLIFDLSLLEGEDTQSKYQAIGGMEGDVRLIGMPKFDAYAGKKNFGKEINNIGICANILDKKELLEALMAQLMLHFPKLSISFRPHPRDDRTFELPKTVQFSNSKEEPIFDFLIRQDAILAGDTSTHLEASMLNVLGIYFSMNDNLSDYYGYVKRGLVEKAGNLEAVIDIVRKYQHDRPKVIGRAQYYNAVIGTPQEGKSRELALQYIKALIGA